MITAEQLFDWFDLNHQEDHERVYRVGCGSSTYIDGTFNLQDLADMINRKAAKAA